MKRILAIALVLGLVLLAALPVATLADAPFVFISGSTAGISGGVNGTFGSGVITWSLNVPGGVSPDSVSTTFTNITNGSLVTSATAYDTTGWHNGQVGVASSFTAKGAFTATYQASDVGADVFGELTAYVNANAQNGVNTSFQTQENVNLDVLSANSNTHVTGQFIANATGTNAAMNLVSYGWGASPGGWQEATNPYYDPALQGQFIGLDIQTAISGVQNGHLDLNANTTGTATISNSNIWGWGVNINGQSTTNYGGGVQTVSATGNGIYQQTGSGTNDLVFNGFDLGSGNAQLIINFINGVSGTYSMSAK